VRRAAVVKVQIARRELGLDEDTYRLVLERVTGKTSSTACTDAELGQVLDAFKAQGWKPQVLIGQKARKPESPKSRARPADHPAAKKARALWLSLWHLGEIRDPSEAALESFARRQLGGDRLQWADQGRVYKLIEALKSMADRAGWSQHLDKTNAGFEIETLKARLLLAQEERLSGRPLLPDEHLATWREGFSDRADGLIAKNGQAIRAKAG
jgi:phage gp16-like protein